MNQSTVLMQEKLMQMKQMHHDYDEAYAQLEKDLFALAVTFETYTELYFFVRKSTPDLQSFNRAMHTLIPIFWNSKKTVKKSLC